MSLDLLVDKSQPATTRLVESPLPALLPGEALLAVDRFGFSANNLTYATLGDELGYWRFFPVPAGHDGWGRIPVWGFADVIDSRSDGVAPGTRLFGYLPMATHLVVTPAAHPAGFTDAREHRRPLPPVYNLYTRVPRRSPGEEAAEMLLRPLFFAAFLVDDYLADHDFFGAQSILIASASSKTAVALAHLLSRARTHEVVGLTADANRAFVARLGSYDRVVSYDAVDSLAVGGRALLVDLAGSAAIRRAVQARLGDKLVHSCVVGNTHAGAPRADEQPGGAPVVPFFGPAQLEKRSRELGAEVVAHRLQAAWRGFAGTVGDWLRVRESRGPVAVEAVYQSLLANRGQPDEGHVLSLAE